MCSLLLSAPCLPRRLAPVIGTVLRSSSSRKQPVDLPDFNTDVDVHTHRLKRPERPPPSPARRWAGLEGLRERTEGSLIPDTLQEMEKDEQFKITAENLRRLGQVKLTREERKKRQRALRKLGIPNFREFLLKNLKENPQEGLEDKHQSLKKQPIEIIQLNIGLYCNQACNHCHVESSPKRMEMMTREVVDKCLEILDRSPSVHTLDITGGAPELNPQFRYLAAGGAALGKKVLDRCNLTVLLEPGQEDLPDFLTQHGVSVVASLPCYSAKNVNMQRGKGVFDKSIQALLMLNERGYGRSGTGLELDLVYNPLGGFLPPPQRELEDKYRQELWDTFGIEFNNLYTVTNMPIKRFADFLYRRNELQDYMNLLVRNFNPMSVKGLMCRNLLSVNWDGRVYDCDFNQQLDLAIPRTRLGLSAKQSAKEGPSTVHPDLKSRGLSVWDFASTDDFLGSRVVTDNHCYGCTAGMGSS
ncbi:Hypp2721 [Branchiostoma lanceolatum]|uniref:Hypp2721 protein n=1 Tax=Branchiostoma lanceolatum TaxID=7740 RepID=A0A8K0EUT1_BRALA|nr:Hypp2721 [Branchiostoma lanceolatum]